MDGVEKIKEILESWSGGWGITEAQPVLGRMGEENRKKALEQVPGLSALLCCVLPYYAGEEEGTCPCMPGGRTITRWRGIIWKKAASSWRSCFPAIHSGAMRIFPPIPRSMPVPGVGWGKSDKTAC